MRGGVSTRAAGHTTVGESPAELCEKDPILDDLWRQLWKCRSPDQMPKDTLSSDKYCAATLTGIESTPT